jgi:predicted transcriptional regulator
MVKLGRISLDHKDMTKFFSPNEVQILELLWERGDLTSHDIQKECPALSLACVAGTLDRLVKSGFVTRKIDDANDRLRYVYSPAGNKEEIGLRISERVIESLVETFGTSTISMLGEQMKKRGQK